jgi:hypothetical protein
LPGVAAGYTSKTAVEESEGVVLGLVLASVAALGFGTGTFVQHTSAVALEHPQARRRTRRGLLGLLAGLVLEPRWLLGQCLAMSGTALQFGAMAVAPVVVVQPVIAAGLPIALMLETIRDRRRPGVRLVVAMGLCVAGLVLFILFSRSGLSSTPPGPAAAVLLLALSVACSLAARLAPAGRAGTLLSGAASGAALGVAVVCAAAAIHRVQVAGAAATVHHWSPYLAAGSGLLATAAAQQAFARGRLRWSLPALTVCNTLVASSLSVLVLRERVDVGEAPVWSTGALLAVAGVVLATVVESGGPRGVAGLGPERATRATADDPRAE